VILELEFGEDVVDRLAQKRSSFDLEGGPT
jgi:hypothetical protein